MKLATIALASAFALSATYALAQSNYYGPNNNYGGGPNNRGGLVGGDDSGTSARYARVPNYGPNYNYGAGPYTGARYYGPSYNYGGGPNNRAGLVGGDDSGTSARYGRVPNYGPYHTEYMKNLHDSGYDPKNDFNANGNMKNQ